MRYIARTFIPFILFMFTLVLIGEINVDSKNQQICEGPYSWSLDTEKNDDEEFINVLNQYTKKNNLIAYAVWYDITAIDEYITIVYSDEQTRQYLKECFNCDSDTNDFNGLFVGKIKVEFKDWDEMIKFDRDETYCMECSEQEYKEFYNTISETFTFVSTQKQMDQKVEDNWVAILLIILSLILIFYKYFDNLSMKKEIYIKYVYGDSKNKRIFTMIAINTITLLGAFLLAKYLSGLLTCPDFKREWTYYAIFIIIAISDLHLLTFLIADIKKVLSTDSVSRKVITFMELSTVFAIIVTTISLSTNMKTINDAYDVVKQDKVWKTYSEYSSMYFKTGMEHFIIGVESRRDDKNMKEFYIENIDKYNMKLNFDTSINSTGSTFEKKIKEQLIYVNKNCKDEIRAIGLDADNMKEKYYVISRYSEDELRENGAFGNIESAFDYKQEEIKVIQIEKDFEWMTFDLRIDNMANNYKKNPVIFYCTTNEPIRSNSFPGIIYMTSILKYDSSFSFDNYIKEIGYENDVYQMDNVYDLYEAGTMESRSLLRINLILSALTLFMFNSVFSTVLVLDFNARAVEIAINKILGKNIIKRYKKIIRFIVIAFILSIYISIKVFGEMDNFYVTYFIIGNVIVLINLLVLVILFIRNYESKCIVNILKGGGL